MNICNKMWDESVIKLARKMEWIDSEETIQNLGNNYKFQLDLGLKLSENNLN